MRQRDVRGAMKKPSHLASRQAAAGLHWGNINKPHDVSVLTTVFNWAADANIPSYSRSCLTVVKNVGVTGSVWRLVSVSYILQWTGTLTVWQDFFDWQPHRHQHTGSHNVCPTGSSFTYHVNLHLLLHMDDPSEQTQNPFYFYGLPFITSRVSGRPQVNTWSLDCNDHVRWVFLIGISHAVSWG